MTELLGQERKPLHRRVWFWVVVAVVVLPVLAFGALVVWFVATPDPFDAEPETIACADAMRSAELETLPADGAACAAGGFQDPYVTIDFVAPRDAFDAWLRSELPETELQQEPCVDGDECLQVSYGEPDAPENGWTLDISATDQGDGTLAVEIMAFSM